MMTLGAQDELDRLMAGTYEGGLPEPDPELYGGKPAASVPATAPGKGMSPATKLALAGGAALAVWFLFIRK